MAHGVTLGPGQVADLLVEGDGGTSTSELDALFERASAASGDLRSSLELARSVAGEIALPGHGGTAGYFEALATLAAADVTVARVVEPHVDAAVILAECPQPVDLAAIGAGPGSTWGVFAAEGAGVRLDAVPDAAGWLLGGTKPWCSLAGDLTHALVTAHVAREGGGVGAAPGAGAGSGGGRRLFAVALRQPGVVAHPEVWVARGFPTIPSGPVDFEAVRAVPVGAEGWYLDRPGFEWGGIGVAACWFGGAVGVARRVVAAAVAKGDDIGALHAGRVAASIVAAQSALAAAARAIDELDSPAADGGSGTPDGADGGGPRAKLQVGSSDADADADADAADGASRAALLAQVTRTIVRRECEAVLREAAHALGPAPLALDAGFAARVADLELYLRQDHGARDEARAGRMLVEAARSAADVDEARPATPGEAGGSASVESARASAPSAVSSAESAAAAVSTTPEAVPSPRGGAR